jgi:hypothetical protein
MKKKKMTESLIELIRESPAIYIRKLSISYLALFVEGYETAIQEIYPDYNDNIMSQFNAWVKIRYPKRVSLRWDGILLEVAGNEADALQLFWQWWDEFLVDYHNGVEVKYVFDYDALTSSDLQVTDIDDLPESDDF